MIDANADLQVGDRIEYVHPHGVMTGTIAKIHSYRTAPPDLSIDWDGGVVVYYPAWICFTYMSIVEDVRANEWQDEFELI